MTITMTVTTKMFGLMRGLGGVAPLTGFARRMTEGQIESPDDPREKVILLPDDQKPYGDQCPLDRKVQSLLFHYGVPAEDVDLLASNGIRQFRHLCVDPDSADFRLISDLFKSVGSRSLMTQVFRRAGQRPDWKESCFPIPSIVDTMNSLAIQMDSLAKGLSKSIRQE